MTRICILQGHPHGTGTHFCHAVAQAYAAGAEAAGARVSRIDVAQVCPEVLCDPADFATPPGGEMVVARQAILDCEHLVVIFPLWLGTMPALLKAFFEQMARAEFALSKGGPNAMPVPCLRGRSARVIVTMGMPALAYRLWFWNRGVGTLKHMILGLAGFRPIRQTLIGGIDGLDDAARAAWLGRIRALGRSLR